MIDTKKLNLDSKLDPDHKLDLVLQDGTTSYFAAHSIASLGNL